MKQKGLRKKRGEFRSVFWFMNVGLGNLIPFRSLKKDKARLKQDF